MSDSPTSSGVAARAPPAAEELLYGFDIPDEETTEFLSGIIASGRAPRAEVDGLRELSLMRGVEEWEMMFECAEALRNGAGGLAWGESSLVPFLGEVIGGCQPGGDKLGGGKTGAAKGRRKESAPRKEKPGKGVSPFWGNAGDGDENRGLGQQKQKSHVLGIWRQENIGQAEPAATRQSEGANGALEGLLVSEPKGTSPDSLDAEVAEPGNQTHSGATSTESRSPARLTLPTRPVSPIPETKRETSRAVKATGTTRSPFFSPSTPVRETQPRPESATPSTKKRARPPRGTVSSLPIPPLSADRFGLIQEELADEPFRLLIAITFLIRTAGKAAIPVFRQLMQRFPTPAALAAADPAEITALIHPLGLSAVRCATIQKYARLWLERPPSRELRYGVKNYPLPGDGRHVRPAEEFGPEDGGGDRPADAVLDARERAVGCAWEIGHLTQGPYALDSWRIFCRDVLLGRSGHWTGRGAAVEFQPEWMRVLPRDKELRACLRWMWYVSSSCRCLLSGCLRSGSQVMSDFHLRSVLWCQSDGERRMLRHTDMLTGCEKVGNGTQ